MIAGELVSIMEDGTERVLRAGDIIVQRGTRHAWRNDSTTVWARIAFVLIGRAEETRTAEEA